MPEGVEGHSMDDTPFAYDGPAESQAAIAEALRQVVDPEIGLSIVDVGLIYAVELSASSCTVQMTMTSAACPLGDLMVNDVHEALEKVLPPTVMIDVVLVWEPPWTPDRMSDGARRLMQW
jgi:metal-sulfur cluster biosynthetic enzyme